MTEFKWLPNYAIDRLLITRIGQKTYVYVTTILSSWRWGMDTEWYPDVLSQMIADVPRAGIIISSIIASVAVTHSPSLSLLPNPRPQQPCCPCSVDVTFPVAVTPLSIVVTHPAAAAPL